MGIKLREWVCGIRSEVLSREYYLLDQIKEIEETLTFYSVQLINQHSWANKHKE
jgi:hypothetical protein